MKTIPLSLPPVPSEPSADLFDHALAQTNAIIEALWDHGEEPFDEAAFTTASRRFNEILAACPAGYCPAFAITMRDADDVAH